MPKQNPAYHSRDHRPAGWTDAGDPGGADPFNWLTPLPATVTDALAQYKPRTHWIQGVDTFTGPGGFGGSVVVSDDGLDTTLLDTSPAGGTRPTPIINGWYQAAVTVVWDGLTVGDIVDVTLLIGGSFSPGVSFNGFHVSASADSAGFARLHVTVPTLHLTTSEFFEVLVGGSAAGGGTINYTSDLLVALMLPGDP